MARSSDVAIVGAGVSGLTTALCLLRSDVPVTLYFREPPERSTSAVAAAIWHAYLAEPQDRVLGWAGTSFARFEVLSSEPRTGVRMVEGIEARVGRDQLGWGDTPPTLREAILDQLPPGVESGFIATVPLIDMRLYLEWLLGECRQRGLHMEQRTLATLPELGAEHRVAVNCSGLGARELAGDASLYPIRGQVVRVIAPEVTSFLLDDENPAGMTYVIPRTDCVVIGGTAERGMSSLDPDPETRDAMLGRAARLVPALAGAPVREEAVGLRPGRPAVRLESETIGDALVVHNYGHAGAGVTLSWGCAEEATGLVLAALEPDRP